jgi:tetratricopeptide (TPR) repeat protein
LLAVVFGKLGEAGAERGELDWLAEHEVGAAAGQPGDVLPLPRIKKTYDGRAFRLLELTVHNAMEARFANASPQQHIDAHLAQGKKLLGESRYGEAERELAEVVSLSPSDPQVHILLAQALEAEGKHQEAAEELQTSLKLRDTAEAHLSLAHVYLSMNQPELARSQGQAALNLDPGNLQAEQILEQIHAGNPAARKTP